MSIFEKDPFGFPLLPESLEMSESEREERRKKAFAAKAVKEAVQSRTDLNFDEKEQLEYAKMTSQEDTLALIKAGLLGKVLSSAERDVVPDFGPAYDEGVLAGVNWFVDEHTDRIYLDVHVYQMIEDELQGFSGMVLGDGRSVYSQEEIEQLAAIADSKTYEP